MKKTLKKSKAQLQRTYSGFNVVVNEAFLSFVIINEGEFAGHYAVNFDTLTVKKLR